MFINFRECAKRQKVYYVLQNCRSREAAGAKQSDANGDDFGAAVHPREPQHPDPGDPGQGSDALAPEQEQASGGVAGVGKTAGCGQAELVTG